MNVPFIDLRLQYRNLRDQVIAGIDSVCSRASFILGPEVSQFESDFAAFLDADQCIGVANGTDALSLAFEALGIGRGDEVIIPAHTFVATAIGVIKSGARPILADIDPQTYLIDLNQAESLITSKTKAICPVHLYGRACNMDRVMALAKKYSLAVVEDAAQSHGAKWNGKCTGTFGSYGCFSFYPGKNLGAYGDGGAVAAADSELARQIKKLRNYGSEVKYFHPEKGTNSRLDSVQAVVLSAKLKHLRDWNEKRWEAARRYCELMRPLEDYGLGLPDLAAKESHVFHLFVIQLPKREKVMELLAAAGVQTGIHYPYPFHLQEGYRDLGYKKGAFPVTEQIAERILSLPMFPEITAEQLGYVAEQMVSALR